MRVLVIGERVICSPKRSDITFVFSEVKGWTDFLKVHLHPRYVCPLPLKRGYNFNSYFAGLIWYMPA
jgi:hypothetical protein